MSEIKVLFEDRSVIVIEKPAGLATQSADVRQKDCVSLIKEHIRKCGADKEPYVGVVHRLDQPVAGVLVFARDRKAASVLSKQVGSDMFNKHYRALVEGIVDVPEETTLTDLIYKDSKFHKAVIASSEADAVKVQNAKLMYRTEKILTAENMTILSIRLLTGRFHQIRAQFAHMGHPIVGDGKYGATTSYPSGIALVADKLEFIHPVSGEKVEKDVDFSFALC